MYFDVNIKQTNEPIYLTLNEIGLFTLIDSIIVYKLNNNLSLICSRLLMGRIVFRWASRSS